MDDAISRVPEAPAPPLTMTEGAAPGVPTCALLVALAVRHRCNDLDRPFDDTLHQGPSLVNHVFQLCQCLGCLHAVIPPPLEAFGKHMLHQAPDKGIDSDGCPFHPLRLM